MFTRWVLSWYICIVVKPMVMGKNLDLKVYMPKKVIFSWSKIMSRDKIITYFETGSSQTRYIKISIQNIFLFWEKILFLENKKMVLGCVSLAAPCNPLVCHHLRLILRFSYLIPTLARISLVSKHLAMFGDVLRVQISHR